jgi:anti-anti-sigma factor
MPTSLEVTGESGRIILTGKFDFSVHDEFRQTITKALENKTIHEIKVDLEKVTFMDSSAISLLLYLNEKASQQGKSVILANCPEPIREIFAIGGFDNILKIR